VQAATQATGRSIIGGAPVCDGEPIAAMFASIAPADGSAAGTQFVCATAADVRRACEGAARAFESGVLAEAGTRAALLERIATNLLDLGDTLVREACRETALPGPRIAGERDRTVAQLRLFAALARSGSWVEATIDTADPTRTPMPKPDVRRMLRPLGPVAVFGASNFPLAYSVAGGDTASALAAGCPVIVKGHPSHPTTGELVALAVADAAKECGIDHGCFAFLHSGGERAVAVGRELVSNERIKAVGFTGSFKGGMALHQLAQERGTPIPVFAEMGSTNPVCMTASALASRGAEIATKLAASMTASGGQMCTCPGLVFVTRGAGLDAWIESLAAQATAQPRQVMLNPGVKAGYVARVEQSRPSTTEVGGTTTGTAGPHVLRTTLAAFIEDETLHEEIFGPAAIVVECELDEDLLRIGEVIRGSLTATLWADPGEPLTGRLMARLERIAGRVVFCGVPTGVEVCPSMVHGGPFPATNQPHSSAVGTLAIVRWCRPVCYQGVPDALLPSELRAKNPLGVRRTVNGVVE